ncbi:unnamed protein product [Prunus armeniaca]
MSSEDGSKSPSSQVPLYLWGGSLVYINRFVANLHHVTTEAQFQKCLAAYASAILDDMHVKLAKPRTNDVPCVDMNDPDARIITFRGVRAMECAPSQCTLNVYLAIKCFENLSLRRFEKYAQVRICNVKLFDSFSQGDHVWHDDVEVSGLWEGDVGDGPLVPITYCNASYISKKLKLEPEMAKDVERWKQNGLDPDDLLVGHEECSAESPSKRKAAVKYSRDEATSSVKHLVGADSGKVGGRRGVQGVLPEPHLDKLENYDLLRETALAQSSSAERQRDADIPFQSSSHLHQSKDGDRSGSVLLQHQVNPKVNKSSPVGNACISDLLKTNFLSNPSSYAELVDHIRQAGDLGTFLSLSLERQRKMTFHLIKKGLVFDIETIHNSSVVAPSSAQLSELEKKNDELASKLSVREVTYGMTMWKSAEASDISKKLKLELDMVKVGRALNIPPKFHEWCWLLSEYREEVGGLPFVQDVERWKQNGPDPDDLFVGHEECSAESPSKRKADVKVKYLVGANNRKVGGMRGVRGVLPEPQLNNLENYDLLRETALIRSSSAERQRDADIPLRSLSRLHQSEDGNRSGRSAHDPAVKSQAVKHGVDSASLTLDVMLAEVKKTREPSARAKGSSSTLAVDPKAGNLGTFSSLSLERQKEATFHLIQKGLVCATETIQNSSTVALSSAQLSELDKKNAELASKLSAE